MISTVGLVAILTDGEIDEEPGGSVWWRALSAMLVMAPAAVFGFLGDAAQMGVATVAGALAAGFLNLDQIQRLKGAGFEAEMKRAVERAYATVDSLRSLAKPLIRATLNILTMAGRIGGMDLREKHAFRAELEEMAKALGLDADTDLRAEHEAFFRFHTWDHYSSFSYEVLQDNSIPREVREGLEGLKEYESVAYPSGEQIGKILGEHMEELSAKARELLQDYLYYLENRQLRRPNQAQ